MSRNRAWPLAASMAALVAALVATASAASANGGVAMAVDVTNSRQTIVDNTSGVCTWEVSSSVTIVNITSQSQTIDTVGYAVSWTSPGSSGVQNAVTVLNDAGLQPGVTLAPDERRTFSPIDVQVGIPCAADYGDLAIRVRSALGTGSGDAPFLEGGTAVPPGAVGLSLLAVLLGVQFVASRRHRTPELATVRR